MSNESTNIPVEMKPAADPEALAEFIKRHQKDSPAPVEKAPEEPTPEFPRNADFDTPPPNDAFFTQSFVDTSSLVITEDDKVRFVKAIMNDQPVRFLIQLFKGQLNIEMRSRRTYEQKRIFDIINQDVEDKLYKDTDAHMIATRMQWYAAAIMTERINNVIFSAIDLKVGSDLKDDTKIMREFVAKNFESMSGIRWTAIQNALRIFESKCAKLGAEASNEGFWIPQG